MMCLVSKNIYLQVLAVCKKARLVMIQDDKVIISFDEEELKKSETIRELDAIFKNVR